MNSITWNHVESFQCRVLKCSDPRLAGGEHLHLLTSIRSPAQKACVTLALERCYFERELCLLGLVEFLESCGGLAVFKLMVNVPNMKLKEINLSFLVKNKLHL